MHIQTRMSDIHQARQAAAALKARAEREQRPLTETERVAAKLAIAHANKMANTAPVSEHLPSPKPGPFANIGQQLMAIRNSETPGGPPDGRLAIINSAMSSVVGSEGGFLIQESFINDLLMDVWEQSNIANLCWRIPVSGNSVKIPALSEASRADGSRHGGVTAYWPAESSELTATKPTVRQMELVLKKMAILIYASDEIMEDASILGAVIRKLAISELAFQIDNQILHGPGGGRPLGVLAAGANVSVAAEQNQAAGSIVYENLLAMWGALLPEARKDAVWLINPESEPQLYKLYLTIGDSGAPVYLPPSGASGDQYSRLFGRPVIPCEQCSAPGVVGDIVLGDFGRGYVLAEKAAGIKAQQSIHVRFIFDESAFKWIYRFDGQPTIAAPIAPANGTVSRSYFATIAARE
jgi:HK97 family phage major capsid protein